MNENLQSVGAVLFSVASAGAIIIAVSRWFSGIIAKRLEQSYQLQLERSKENEMDLLLRRREVYTRLIKSMRLFITSDNQNTLEEKKEFLKAYDECCLWAPDNVLDAIGDFLEFSNRYSQDSKSVNQLEYQNSYKKCIEAIRQNSGFKNTNLTYKFVNFEN